MTIFPVITLVAVSINLLVTAMRSDKSFRQPKTDGEIVSIRVVNTLYALGLLSVVVWIVSA